MIAPAYDFEQFLAAVSEKPALDIVALADQEAVAAWRWAYQKTRRTGQPAVSSQSYQEKLLALIDYVRFGIKSGTFSPRERQFLKSLSDQQINH